MGCLSYKLYRLFLSPHSLSVTTVTLGSRLFFYSAANKLTSSFAFLHSHLTTTTGRRVRYHLCLLLLVRVGGYIVNLLDFYSYRLIGKLTAFFQLQEFSFRKQTPVATDQFHFRHSAFVSMIKSRVGNILVKASALRINLNLDGAPIASKSHTHPSHSQTSRLLTSSLSLGVPVPRPTQCMRGA